jgi:hypothetical protein
LIVMIFIAVVAGCSWKGTLQTQTTQAAETPAPSPTYTPPASGDKADAISYIYTTKRAFSIAFSGMAEKDTMESILNELDKYKIENTVETKTTNGSIILFHLMIQLDTYKALPSIIEYYQQRGYTFVTASQLIS